MLDEIKRHFEFENDGKARWLPLEGMRGLAVLLVFFVHYSSGMESWFSEKFEYIDFIHAIGNTGVDIFFVMSGFLIYRAVIRRPINYYLYAMRRIERIYPTFLFVFSIYIALSVAFPGKSKFPDTGVVNYIIYNLFLLPGLFDITPIITVAWSLSYEAFYYILIPFVVAFCALRRWNSQSRIILFLSILIVYLIGATAGYASHFRLTMFIGGILLYEITGLKPGAPRNAVFDTVSLILLLVVLLRFGYDKHTPFNYVTLNIALVIVLYRCLYAPGPAASIFAFRPMRWLGNMSYTYYLMHSLGLHIFFSGLAHLPVFPSAWTYVLLIPVAFAITVLASVPVYLLIERPFSLTPAPVKEAETP